MQTFKKVSPGQKKPRGFPAAMYNGIIDLMQNNGAAEHPDGFGKGTYRPGSTIIQIENETGIDLDPFSVVTIRRGAFGLSGTQAEEAYHSEGIVAKAEVPQLDEPIAITIESIPENKVGKAVIAGPVICEIDVKDESHNFAKIVEEETDLLESALSGPVRILYKGIGTGVMTAAVLVGQNMPTTFVLKVEIGEYDPSGSIEHLPVIDDVKVVTPGDFEITEETTPPIPTEVANPLKFRPDPGSTGYAIYRWKEDEQEEGEFELLSVSHATLFVQGSVVGESSGRTITVSNIRVLIPKGTANPPIDSNEFQNPFGFEPEPGDEFLAICDGERYIAIGPGSGGDKKVWKCKVRLTQDSPGRTGTGIEDAENIRVSTLPDDAPVILEPPNAVFDTERDENGNKIPGKVYAPGSYVSNPKRYPFFVTDDDAPPWITVRHDPDDANQWVVDDAQFIQTHFEGEIIRRVGTVSVSPYEVGLYTGVERNLTDSSIVAGIIFLDPPPEEEFEAGKKVSVEWTPAYGYQIVPNNRSDKVWTCKVRPQVALTGIVEGSQFRVSQATGSAPKILEPPDAVFDTELDENGHQIPGNVYVPNPYVSNPKGFPFLVTNINSPPWITVRHDPDDQNGWVVDDAQFIQTHFEGETIGSPVNSRYRILLHTNSGGTTSESEIWATPTEEIDPLNSGTKVSVDWTPTHGFRFVYVGESAPKVWTCMVQVNASSTGIVDGDFQVSQASTPVVLEPPNAVFDTELDANGHQIPGNVYAPQSVTNPSGFPFFVKNTNDLPWVIVRFNPVTEGWVVDYSQFIQTYYEGEIRGKSGTTSAAPYEVALYTGTGSATANNTIIATTKYLKSGDDEELETGTAIGITWSPIYGYRITECDE